ncbi:MAG TPA: DUF3891 family protein [Acidobacteriota bacterium]|nr:DUF3891 family protein [Acidobacteriota bacterium]
MVIRELKDGRTYVSLQEDHAELAAQFAAHWGNQRFSRLRPYQTMVFATTFHDSGYRDFEGNPPMNVEKGRPYAHREEVPNFEAVELTAYAHNADWVSSHDLYAGLLVSMHRTGLWHNRYNIFTEPAGRLRERSQAVQDAKKAMEAKQEEIKRQLAIHRASFDNELAYNYMALQIFDLLSLYFCCDGYANDSEFKPYTIAPVRVSYDSNETVALTIKPNGAGSVIFDPYPFDTSPLKVSARTRIIAPPKTKSEAACVDAYHKAARELLTFQISA